MRPLYDDWDYFSGLRNRGGLVLYGMKPHNHKREQLIDSLIIGLIGFSIGAGCVLVAFYFLR